jgi:hypothetical protein
LEQQRKVTVLSRLFRHAKRSIGRLSRSGWTGKTKSKEQASMGR